MAENWTITPLVGVGPLTFGMTRADVAALEPLLGAIYAEFETQGPDGQPIIQQGRDLEVPVLYFRQERLTGIQLDHHSRFDIRFAGVSVFGDPSRAVLSTMETANGGALWGLGAVLFEKLSISTNGFLEGFAADGRPVFWEETSDRAPRVVNMELQGAYLPYLANYQPISIGP